MNNKFTDEAKKLLKSGEFVPDGDFICGNINCDICEIGNLCHRFPRIKIMKPHLKDIYPEFYI